jgi:putative transposase
VPSAGAEVYCVKLPTTPYFCELPAQLPFAIYFAVLTKIYRRHLPHILPAASTIFLTWRLRGSLPPGFVFDRPDQRNLSDGVSFGKMDKLLDGATHGPRWLADFAIAEELCRTIEHGAEAPLSRFVLHEYVVMPNHVHLLISPKIDVSRITQGIKGATARFANLQLGRTGAAFWQDETFDRFCRSPEECQRIRGYIARNPVRAGLAKAMGEWPWSSAHRRITSAPKAHPTESGVQTG